MVKKMKRTLLMLALLASPMLLSAQSVKGIVKDDGSNKRRKEHEKIFTHIDFINNNDKHGACSKVYSKSKRKQWRKN